MAERWTREKEIKIFTIGISSLPRQGTKPEPERQSGRNEGERILHHLQFFSASAESKNLTSELLKDEFYIGLKPKRVTSQEYAELMQEFMTTVKRIYGENVLIQFEDFANHNAFDQLAKYGSTHLVFNDDIQGTASMVLAGLLVAQKMTGNALADHRYLFLGAGEAGTGIAELIALEISKQARAFYYVIEFCEML